MKKTIMSKEALTNLRDYIQLTLSLKDMRWLADELDTYANKQEQLKPYTMEEINAMIDQGERDLAEGRYRDIEDLFKEWDEEENMTYAAEAEPEYNGRRV